MTAAAQNDNAALASALAPVLAAPAAPVVDFRQGPRGWERRQPCDGCQEVGWFRRNGPYLCQACAARQLAEVAARERLAPIAPALASIPETFRSLRLDGADLGGRVRSDIGRAMAARMAPLDEPRTVLLAGGTGAGKTSLAAAMLGWHLDRATREGATESEKDWGRRCLFVHARHLALARRQTPLGAEPELITRAREASVLLVDDLGQEAPSDKDDVVSLLSDRHADRRPTLVTYGFGLDELAARYGAQLERRLRDRAGLIDLGVT